MAVRRHTRRHTSLSEAGVAPLCVYATARIFALPSLHSCVRIFAYALVRLCVLPSLRVRVSLYTCVIFAHFIMLVCLSIYTCNSARFYQFVRVSSLRARVHLAAFMCFKDNLYSRRSFACRPACLPVMGFTFIPLCVCLSLYQSFFSLFLYIC